MKHLICAHVRRRVAAFHDRELSIEEQIAVESHLQDCRRCAAEAARLQAIGDLLRAESTNLAQASFADIDGLRAGVMSRMKAEREESWPSRIGRLFEDLHLVYAGLGAAGATLACLVVMFGMMHFGAHERPDSLAALVEVLSAPAAGPNAIMSDGRLVTAQPKALRDDGEESNAVFTLSNAVTEQGRLRNLDAGAPAIQAQQAREEILNLMDTIIEAQTRPVPFVDGGSPWNIWRLHVTVPGHLPRVSPAASHVSKQSLRSEPTEVVAAT